MSFHLTKLEALTVKEEAVHGAAIVQMPCSDILGDDINIYNIFIYLWISLLVYRLAQFQLWKVNVVEDRYTFTLFGTDLCIGFCGILLI